MIITIQCRKSKHTNDDLLFIINIKTKIEKEKRIIYNTLNFVYFLQLKSEIFQPIFKKLKLHYASSIKNRFL